MSQPAHVRAIAKAGADGVIVASALVDAMGTDGRDVAGLAALVAHLAGRDRWALSAASRDATTRTGSRRRWRSVAKRTFQWAIDWPGWCRSGKTELDALERFIAASERYNVVIERAGPRAARRQRP